MLCVCKIFLPDFHQSLQNMLAMGERDTRWIYSVLEDTDWVCDFVETGTIRFGAIVIDSGGGIDTIHGGRELW